jgi:hypothetical protein
MPVDADAARCRSSLGVDVLIAEGGSGSNRCRCATLCACVGARRATGGYGAATRFVGADGFCRQTSATRRPMGEH